PVLPGMFQSVSTRSNSPGLNLATASAPSAASVAPSAPAARSERRMSLRIALESSATRTRRPISKVSPGFFRRQLPRKNIGSACGASSGAGQDGLAFRIVPTVAVARLPQHASQGLANFAFDFSLEHHGGERQIDVHFDVRIAHRADARNLEAEGLEAELQRVLRPLFLQVAHLVLVLFLEP